MKKSFITSEPGLLQLIRTTHKQVVGVSEFLRTCENKPDLSGKNCRFSISLFISYTQVVNLGTTTKLC